MSAGAVLRMWALGNHITLSLWSIPEPVIIYSVLLVHPHTLPTSLFLLHICTVLSLSLYFQSLFCLCHSSSLSSISHSHTHSVGYYVLLLSLVCLWSLDIFLVSSLFFPCSLTLCPQARRSSTFPSSPAVPCLSLQHVHPCPPPPPLFFCPQSHVCMLSEGEYWFHARLTGTVMDDLVCVRVCVCMCTRARAFVCVCVYVLVGCLSNSHGNNSSAQADGCWAGRQVGRRAAGVRGSSACTVAQPDRQRLKATLSNIGMPSNNDLFFLREKWPDLLCENSTIRQQADFGNHLGIWYYYCNVPHWF